MAGAKKNSGTLYKCTIVAPDGQLSHHKCEILAVNKNVSVHIRYKKPRSSKYAKKHVPWSQIIAYGGEKGSTEGFISYRANKVAVLRPFKGYVQVDDENTGMLIVTSEDNEVYKVRPECLEAIADETDDNEPEKKVVKKKAA